MLHFKYVHLQNLILSVWFHSKCIQKKIYSFICNSHFTSIQSIWKISNVAHSRSLLFTHDIKKLFRWNKSGANFIFRRDTKKKSKEVKKGKLFPRIESSGYILCMTPPRTCRKKEENFTDVFLTSFLDNGKF